jgi:hypothetical protein
MPLPRKPAKPAKKPPVPKPPARPAAKKPEKAPKGYSFKNVRMLVKDDNEEA